MNGKALYVGVLTAVMVAGVLHAEEPRPMLRNFDRFEFDTGTARGFWLEVQTFYDTKSGMRALDTPSFRNRVNPPPPGSPFGTLPRTVDVDTLRVESRLVGGGENFEAGVIIPYVFVDDHGTAHDQSNVGDVRVYLKAIPIRTQWVDAGLGYDISSESGDHSEGFGYGAVGHLPFVTGTGHLGPVDLNVHFGHRFVNTHRSDPGESWVYGAAAHYPILANLSARVEFVGQSFRQGTNFDALAIEPGVDYTVPLGPIELMLRPTVAVGLNEDTSEWGAGGSIVLRYAQARDAQVRDTPRAP